MPQDESIKSLEITSETTTRGRDVAKFMPIVEMIAKKEMKSNAGQLLGYDELINTGLIAVNKLIEQAQHKKDTTYNSSYIAQSVKWAIKDEMRSRQGWYGVRRTEKVETKEDDDEIDPNSVSSVDEARRVIYETIMSVESMEEDTGYTAPDDSDPQMLEHMELVEMKHSLLKSINKLPENLQQVVKMRFYEEQSGNEVAQALGVTPSRISHMIKEAVKKLQVLMAAEGYKDAV